MITDRKSLFSLSIVAIQPTISPSGIDVMKYNIRLRSAWEAEENYNFRENHFPGCKQIVGGEKCMCGNQTKKELMDEKRLRKELDEARKRIIAGSTASSEEQKTLAGMEKLEESGDEEFIVKTPIKGAPTKGIPTKGTPTKGRLKVGGGTPKGRGKTVTFAD